MFASEFRLLVSNRLRSYKISKLIWLECEAWLVQLCGWIPGSIGFIVRSLVYKGLAKKLVGICFIQPNVRLVEARRIEIGRNFSVNSGTYLNGIGGIFFGDNVLIGPNVVISSGEHPISDPSMPILFQQPKGRKIHIHSGVWIGANVVVLPGVSIGEGSVIAANAVVTKSVGPHEVWGGVPAKQIKIRNS
jgi:acetyltransferase-like isoleucine patch superfamily enzyme